MGAESGGKPTFDPRATQGLDHIGPYPEETGVEMHMTQISRFGFVHTYALSVLDAKRKHFTQPWRQAPISYLSMTQDSACAASYHCRIHSWSRMASQ